MSQERTFPPWICCKVTDFYLHNLADGNTESAALPVRQLGEVPVMGQDRSGEQITPPHCTAVALCIHSVLVGLVTQPLVFKPLRLLGITCCPPGYQMVPVKQSYGKEQSTIVPAGIMHLSEPGEHLGYVPLGLSG